MAKIATIETAKEKWLTKQAKKTQEDERKTEEKIKRQENDLINTCTENVVCQIQEHAHENTEIMVEKEKMEPQLQQI